MSRYWYSFVVNNSDPRLAQGYQLIDKGKPECFNGTRICAIYSTAGGPFPFSPLSANLISYISTALATSRPQPLQGKYHVYLKQQ
jgi:hypothetical protein